MSTPLPLKLAFPILLAGLALGYGAGRARSIAKDQMEPPPAAETAPGLQEKAAPLSESGEPHRLKEILSRSTDREAILWLRLRWGEFTSRDYAAAATDVIALGLGRHEALFGELMEAWGQAAPAEAMAFVEKQPEVLKKAAFEAIVRGWSEADPDALLTWYQARKEEYSTRKLKATITGALAKTRPEAAFHLLAENGGKRDRESADAFFTTLAKISPQQALQFLDRPSASEQEESVQSLLLGWTMVAPDAAAAWVSSQPKGNLRQKGFQTLIGSLSLSAPREAAELAMKELTDPTVARTAAYTVAQMWASTEPEEAERFFAGQPDTPFKKEALRIIEAQWASRHPLDYLNQPVEMGDFSQEAFIALNTAFATLAQQDEGELRRWLGKNRHEIPPNLLARMIASSVFGNPKGAAELLALLPEGAQADNAYRLTATNWARQDMEGARQFLATLPEGNARNHFQIALLGTLAETNLPEALREIEAASLQKTPEGATRDTLVNSFSVAIVQRDPDMAIQWASTIGDEKKRATAMQQIARQWLNADRNAAREWIRSAPFTDRQKADLLKD